MIVYRNESDFIEIESSAPIPPGTVVILGDLIGITKNSILPGRRGIAFLSGKFVQFPKKANIIGEELQRGKIVWYNPADGKIHNTQNEGYLPIGYAFEDMPSDAEFCTILLQNGLGGESSGGETGRVIYAPEADTAANAVVIIGSLVTVSDAAINADEPGVLRYTGEFVLAKAPGAIDSGQIVHAKADGKIYGTASAGAIPCGYALESAESDAPYIRILLIPTGQPSA